MITLYSVDWCSYCRMVERRLQELGLAFDKVIVPDGQRDRTEVHRVSGQWTVPVLVHDGHVFADETAILRHLDEVEARSGS